MAGFLNALSASFVLMLLMSVGYFMGRIGWMGLSEKQFLSKYILNIAVPCSCITGLLGNLDHDGLKEAGVMVIAGFAGIAATMLISYILAKLLRLPRERFGVFVAMAGLSNALFIGVPVSTQLFGEASIPFIMIYYLGNTTFMQSAGIQFIEYSGKPAEGHFSIKAFLKSLLLKPPILSIIFSIILLVLDLKLPETLMTFIGYINQTVSPMALIYCGYVLYELGFKNLRLMRGLPTMLVMRLGIAPFICMAVCMLFGMQGLPLNVFVTESALPVASQVPVLAGAFGADDKYAATGAVLSTLFSFISIPVLMLMVGG